MSIVSAKCPQCGANIKVNSEQEAALCERCRAPFSVENAILYYQSINNINNVSIDNSSIHYHNVSTENLLKRAKAYEDMGNTEQAIKCYNAILDVDINHEEANRLLNKLTTRFIGNIQISVDQAEKIDSYLHQAEKAKENATILVRGLTGASMEDAEKFVDSHKRGNWEKGNSIHTSQKSGGCYVATAVYGNYDCPEVWVLRRFRDYTLAKTWYGRAFIHTYYTISPVVVKYFGNTKAFKSFFKPRLDSFVQKLKSQGYSEAPYDDREW